MNVKCSASVTSILCVLNMSQQLLAPELIQACLILGGMVDKNPSADAGDMSLIPGLERFHMPWGN